ncbi:MAG: hypothetical protein NVSMB34_03550 [Variovorax sp.]
MVEYTCDADTLINSHNEVHTMLRAGKALRFTPDEVEEFRSLGLDFEQAQTQDDMEQALAAWTETLADERPDLLNKIVAEMARSKGVKLPAQLTVVKDASPSSGSLRQS